MDRIRPMSTEQDQGEPNMTKMDRMDQLEPKWTKQDQNTQQKYKRNTICSGKIWFKNQMNRIMML